MPTSLGNGEPAARPRREQAAGHPRELGTGQGVGPSTQYRPGAKKMFWRNFWRVGAVLIALHAAGTLLARIDGDQVDLFGLIIEILALVVACRHIKHEFA